MIEVVVHLPRFAVVQKATKLNFCLQTHQSPINTHMVEEHSSSLHITHYKLDRVNCANSALKAVQNGEK